MSVNPIWLASFGSECWYCGGTLTSKSATVDHVIPLCRSGSWEKENLVPACETCNKSKKEKTGDEFIASRVSFQQRHRFAPLLLLPKAKPLHVSEVEISPASTIDGISFVEITTFTERNLNTPKPQKKKVFQRQLFPLYPECRSCNSSGWIVGDDRRARRCACRDQMPIMFNSAVERDRAELLRLQRSIPTLTERMDQARRLSEGMIHIVERVGQRDLFVPQERRQLLMQQAKVAAAKKQNESTNSLPQLQSKIGGSHV